MKLIAGTLALLCIVVVLVNEGIRVKHGFISNRHFTVFWVVWALVLVGMGVAVGLLLSTVL
jgi:hypothetical protein